MKKTNRKRASALVVAIGMLAVLSAMAFTYVAVMSLEREASVASEMSTQTGLLHHWAAQQVADKLIRTRYEGAMYTPVDWAGEEWYTRPLIEGSPSLPLGGAMSFQAFLSGKGDFTIDARVMDCSSQINLADGDLSDSDVFARKMRLLSALPFGIEYRWDGNTLQRVGDAPQSIGEALAGELLDIVRDMGPRLTTKEMLLQAIMGSGFSVYATADYMSTEDQLAEYFMGKKDEAGNVMTVGFKDFITLHSWVDDRMLSTFTVTVQRPPPQPRAPININTAPSWTLTGLFSGIRSTETSIGSSISQGGAIDPEVADLVGYIIAYRTPANHLPNELLTKQNELIGWINDCFDYKDDDYVPDPQTLDELKAQLNRLAHLLKNPEPDKVPDGMREDDFNELPRAFATWAQFDAFLKLLVCNGKLGGSSVEIGRKKARAIMANCNPNTNYSMQPIRNGCVQWNCGKDNLTQATTELCFGSYGMFETEMLLGRAIVMQTGSESNFPEPGYNKFSSPELDTSNLRTINGSIYTPDRICFYNEDDELLMMRAILDAETGTRVKLDRNVEPLLSRGGRTTRLKLLKRVVSSWAIQRLDSTKKWTAIIKFADVIRIDTEADFLASDNPEVFGTGAGALFLPQPKTDRRSRLASLADGITFPTEVDGSIVMQTEQPDANASHLREIFTDDKTVGSRGRFQWLYFPLYSSGVWPRENGAFQYDEMNDIFPNKTKDPLSFTATMWICLNSDGASGKIIEFDNTSVSGNDISKILFEIQGGSLSLDLIGMVQTVPGSDARIQMGLSLDGDNAISVADWMPGEWHWVGFDFKELNDQGRTEASIFAAKFKDDKLEFIKKTDTLPDNARMFLYPDNPSGAVSIGTIDAGIDDIIVRQNVENIEDLMPKTRFEKSTYTSPSIDPSKISGIAGETEIEYGTVSWTEYMTSRSFQLKDSSSDEGKAHFSDAHVSVRKGSARIGSTAGVLVDDDRLEQIPRWLSHADILGGWKPRIGRCGEGQRLGDADDDDDDDDDDVKENPTGTASQKLCVQIVLYGPTDKGSGSSGSQDNANIETPCIDDVTVTYFSPLQVLYWKESTDPSE